uniref:Uncharacterized protein n=1 Tax=Haptolina brevifila TaxID=156173 RepID=A0A7S2NMJ1_9EUKA|mmetsp:Transcript_82696/g.165024  ORF Transcript_82696/g.165024 Transcript_82696/m.165024 type:complete len:239 (+) Transcript_82696:195-911(+)
MLESIPQVNYHEPVGTLPALPVNATCGLVRTGLSDDELLNGLGIVTTWYYGSGAAETAAQEKAAGVAGGAQRACVPENSARNLQVGGGVPGDGPDPSSSWGYQSCTETLHQFSTLPGSWRSYNFSLPSVSELCQTYYGVTPRTTWLELWSGGYEIGGVGGSNIIWSNGRRDPWYGGGFLRQSDALPGGAVFVMEQTAHHQDLRAPQPTDPAELTAVRQKEEVIIRKWIAEWAAAHRGN